MLGSENAFLITGLPGNSLNVLFVNYTPEKVGFGAGDQFQTQWKTMMF